MTHAAFSELAQEEQTLSASRFLPSECDCKIRATWFYDKNEETLKTLDELFGMYEMSVGHGSNFLLNIGPDNHGKLPQADATRLSALGKRIRAVYGNPLPYRSMEREEENADAYSITHPDFDIKEWGVPPTSPLSNRLAITEDITEGQSVTSFKVYAHLPVYKKKRILIYEGKTIGHKLICTFSAIRASKFTLEITGHDGEYKILDMKAYFAK